MAPLVELHYDRWVPTVQQTDRPSDWIVVLSEDNWEICEREQQLALGRDADRRLGRMADGDRLWVYVNRKHVNHQVPRIQRLRAIARVAGPIRHLDQSPWKPRGNQRFHVARPITIEQRCDVPAVDLLRRMSFAGPYPAWGIRLRSAPLRLTASDVAALEAAVT